MPKLKTNGVSLPVDVIADYAAIGEQLAKKDGLTKPYSVPQVIAMAREPFKREKNLV